VIVVVKRTYFDESFSSASHSFTWHGSANERTFLAWMHLSIILAGASIAILAFSGNSENPVSQIYGVVMLPVAIAFIVYSMYQCECIGYVSICISFGDGVLLIPIPLYLYVLS
jgi:Domain of unknown function (DUF202)